MRTPMLAVSLVPLVAVLGASSVQAQNIHISPVVGAFHPSSNLEDLHQGGVDNLAKDNVLALGVNVEAAFLRASVVYATKATISDDGGVEGSGDIGDGSLLAVTGDFVFRPIPRIAGLQPYALGGVGIKHDNYSFTDDDFSEIEDNSDFAWHIGLGADLMRGNVGIMAEVSDFITSTSGATFGRHDTFAMVGLRLRAF